MTPFAFFNADWLLESRLIGLGLVGDAWEAKRLRYLEFPGIHTSVDECEVLRYEKA